MIDVNRHQTGAVLQAFNGFLAVFRFAGHPLRLERIPLRLNSFGGCFSMLAIARTTSVVTRFRGGKL